MKFFAFVFALIVLVSNAPAGNLIRCQAPQTTEFYSFENDEEGWTVKATDLTLTTGDPIPWSITRTQERADDGISSFKIFLQSFNSRGKIWLEKPFSVEPNRIYQVKVKYALGSTGGDLGANTIITGALAKRPVTGIDLIPAYKDLASNENTSPGVFSWEKRNYEFTVLTGNEGTIYAVIGMWGTDSIQRFMYVDSVSVTLTLKQDCQFSSFESDLEGWTKNAVDLGSGSADWSIANNQEVWEDGNTSVKFELNNLNDNAKVWLERAFAVEPRNKYKVTLDYALRSRDVGDIPGFRIIAGVFRNRPEAGEDLEPAFQEKTASTHGTWGWLHKTYEFTVKSKKKNALYFVIGIMATQQAHRSYWVDSVCVTITPK